MRPETAAAIQFISIDIDDSETQEEVFMGLYGGVSVPLFIYLRGEREVSRGRGIDRETMVKQLKQLIEYKNE